MLWGLVRFDSWTYQIALSTVDASYLAYYHGVKCVSGLCISGDSVLEVCERYLQEAWKLSAKDL